MKKSTSSTLVGTLELSTIVDEFLAEINIGDVSLSSKIGFCKIEVENNEGMIPHFHIKSKTDNTWKCCIEIYKPKYFIHGNKQGTLNTKQLKILNDWMLESNKFFPSYTNWQVICTYWEAQGNPMKNVPKNAKQPNYTLTNNN